MDHSRGLRSFSSLISRSRSDGTLHGSTFATDSSYSSTVSSIAETDDDKKGPLGLTTLHEPTPPTPAVADIVFIHGLGGGSRKTWSSSPDLGQFWPQAWLSVDNDFQDVRIHSFGYRADWDERQQSILDIHGFAQTLLAAVRNHPTIRRAETRIIFVGHSMGGCVAKKAYLLAHEDPAASDICRRIQSMFFLGTPHRGSDMAAVLDNILRSTSTFGTWGKKRFVADLTPNSAALVAINDSFRHVAPALRLWSFHETLPLRQGVMSRIVVDQHSATLQYHNEEIVPMNADHRTICKFKTPSDPNYHILRNALVTAVDLARATAISRQPTPRLSSSRAQVRLSVRSFLGVQTLPECDLESLRVLRQPGSCRWLSEKDFFTSWTSGTGPHNILWLTGRPGVGKSILSSHVIEQLQSSQFYCSYYMCKNTESGGSLLLDCFRSIAFQMAVQDDRVLDALEQLMQDQPLWDNSDESSFWHHVFASCIFRLPLASRHFWVVDGVDECANSDWLFTKRFLSTIPSNICFFGTSRPVHNIITRGLTSLGSKAYCHSLSDEDTLEDIRLFLNTRLMDLELLEDDSDRERICQKILDQSRGSFLWVRLVLQELEDAFTQEAIEDVLQNIPDHLFYLYDRLTRAIMANSHKAALARSIFKWVVLCSRPLTVDELRDAIKLDTGQTVQNSTKAIPEICSHLLYINQDNRVQLIHETAREFLLSSHADLAFTVNKNGGHTSIACALLDYLQRTFSPRASPPATGLKSRKESASNISANGPLLHYAVRFFSHHVLKATSSNDDLMNRLDDLLRDRAVLYLIEHISKTGDLSAIPRSAMNIREYLKRRSKYVPPTDQSIERAGNWVHDLIRVTAKFRPQLLGQPQSIHSIVPYLCPVSSAISQLAGKQKAGPFRISGHLPTVWDECLSRIDFQGGLATAVAHGSHFFAIGLSTGYITVYNSDSAQCSQKFKHAERVTNLEFSADDTYLASCGAKFLSIWDPTSGTIVHQFSLHSTPLAITFRGSEEIYCALQSGTLIRWNLIGTDSTMTPRHTDLDSEEGPTSRQPVNYRKATRAAFCNLENGELLVAIGYSTPPIMIWNELELSDFKPRLLGLCSPDDDIVTRHINSMCLNSHPEVPVLVVSYQDGTLCGFNYETMSQTFRRRQVYATHLSCSANGRTLIAATSRGAVEIFEFGGSSEITLERIYSSNYVLDEALRDIKFSPDGLRFIDVRAKQGRLWAPGVLVKLSFMDDDLLSTNASTMPESNNLPGALLERPMGMLTPDDVPNITSCLASDGSGKWIVAGKSNGDVVLFSAEAGTAVQTLYRHGRGVSVVFVAMDRNGSIIVSADSGGRVLVTKSAGPLCESATGSSLTRSSSIVQEHRFEKAVRQLLISPAADMVLISGRYWHKLLEIASGATVHSDQPHNPEMKEPKDSSSSDNYAFQHPSNPEWFTIMTESTARLFSWTDFSELTAPDGIRLCRPRHLAGDMPMTDKSAPTASTSSRAASYHVGAKFVLEVIEGRFGSQPDFYIWEDSALNPSATEEPSDVHPRKAPGLDSISPNVLCVLGVMDQTKVVFMDVNLWVCSVDIQSFDAQQPAAPMSTNQNRGGQAQCMVERHFFALSEWKAAFGVFRCVTWPWRGSDGRKSGISVAFANIGDVIVASWDSKYSETVVPMVGKEVLARSATGNGAKTRWQDIWRPVCKE
ncbi:hypothetical protein QBC42DRAFT_267947 [Cladorrhinum samala]|uniref:GPI inositol-deacylase n=1 Tax=Cladorrhinum samala TaxID=585594 RepID=A0AAV9HNL9_9PEZI|nr:hypothetical protein QBC42DRAFT_267947 [Cladorrhinum samala]